jgi:glycerol-3-phosphate dehydrogenase (NAD+)
MATRSIEKGLGHCKDCWTECSQIPGYLCPGCANVYEFILACWQHPINAFSKTCDSRISFAQFNLGTIEEIVNGSRLTELINTTHENPKYLPGIKLPSNIIAEPQLLSSIHEDTLIVFVFPHNYVGSVCEQIRLSVHPGARAISLIKVLYSKAFIKIKTLNQKQGVDSSAGSGMTLISDLIASSLNIDVSVLMGANIANEVAQDKFCETTIGSANKQDGSVFKKLFDTPNFRVSVVEDVAGVELCGALKNVVAIAAGLVDGLKWAFIHALIYA